MENKFNIKYFIKMRKVILGLAAVALILVSFTTVENTATTEVGATELNTITFDGNVDVAASVLYWKGTKIGRASCRERV